jgi:hypothetical protein
MPWHHLWWSIDSNESIRWWKTFHQCLPRCPCRFPLLKQMVASAASRGGFASMRESSPGYRRG